MVLICVFLSTCNQTTNYITSEDKTTNSVYIYPLSYISTYDGSDAGDIAPNYCSGT